MKNKLWLAFLLIAFVACNNSANNTATEVEEYMVRKSTMGCVCTVQLKTAIPIGERHLGPFITKEEARKAMCADIDPTMTDNTHCWEVTPKNTCP
jgi:hypothetical protein